MNLLKSFIIQLEEEFVQLKSLMNNLIEISPIVEFHNDPSSRIVFILPEFEWGEVDEQQTLLQMRLLTGFTNWFEKFYLLFNSAPKDIIQQIENIQSFINTWVQKESNWDLPSSNERAKVVFEEKTKKIFELINLLKDPHSSHIILILDTNSLISEPDFSRYLTLVNQEKITIVLVPTVLAELDKLKIVHRDAEFRKRIGSIINRIKGLRNQGSLLDGVIVHKIILIKMVATEPVFEKTLHWLNHDNLDDRIIASALEIQVANPSDVVILVSSDINLQNKAEMANIPYLEPPSRKEPKNGVF